MSQQLAINFDISRDPCARKHGGSPTSVAAHDRVKHTKRETHDRILGLMKARGDYGLTSKEGAAAIGKPLNCISGRFSELRAMRLIRENGERRNGAAVLILWS